MRMTCADNDAGDQYLPSMQESKGSKIAAAVTGCNACASAAKHASAAYNTGDMATTAVDEDDEVDDEEEEEEEGGDVDDNGVVVDVGGFDLFTFLASLLGVVAAAVAADVSGTGVKNNCSYTSISSSSSSTSAMVLWPAAVPFPPLAPPPFARSCLCLHFAITNSLCIVASSMGIIMLALPSNVCASLLRSKW